MFVFIAGILNSSLLVLPQRDGESSPLPGGKCAGGTLPASQLLLKGGAASQVMEVGEGSDHVWPACTPFPPEPLDPVFPHSRARHRGGLCPLK